MASNEVEEDNHTSARYMNLRIAEQLGLRLVKDLNEIPEIEVDCFFGRKHIISGEEDGYENYKSALCKGLQGQRNNIQMYFEKLFKDYKYVLCEGTAEQLGLRLVEALNEIPEIEVDRFFVSKQIASGEENGYGNYSSALCKGSQGQINNIQMYFDKLFKDCKSVLCEGISEPRITFQCKTLAATEDWPVLSSTSL